MTPRGTVKKTFDFGAKSTTSKIGGVSNPQASDDPEAQPESLRAIVKTADQL